MAMPFAHLSSYQPKTIIQKITMIHDDDMFNYDWG